MTRSLTNCQPDPKPGLWVAVVHVTRGMPDKSCNTLGHKMSLPGEGVHLTKGHPAQSSTKPGHEMSLLGVYLTTGLCDQRSHMLGHKMSLQGGSG